MGREHKILDALAKTDVPVAPVLGLCKDETVNGAPFYVMRFVDGCVLDSADAVRQHVPGAERMGLGWHVIEVLARLHAVDIDAIGLGDLGKREQYLDRQIHRWRTQWEKSKTRELPAMEAVGDALEKLKPPQVAPASCTATTASGTCSRRTGASRRCSTGSCARSATRSPTSAS